MGAKEYLQRYRDCEMRIKGKRRRIQELKEQARSVSYQLSEQVQSSQKGNGVGKIVESYLDMKQELERQVEEFCAVQSQVLQAIDSLEDERLKIVLELHYIEGMTLEQTAEEMDYSCKQVSRIHRQALQELEEGFTFRQLKAAS